MSVESELLVERRAVRQRLTLWRMLAAVIALVLLVVLLAKDGPGDNLHSDHIARVYVSGMILDDAKQQELLKNLQNSEKVKAVLLRINSPGGTTAGGEALYQRIRQLAKEKPVVAVFGTVAASAAYMAGVGADHIVTRGSSITGSVGVIVQWPDMSDMLSKFGITMEELKSGKLKATPTPFKTASKEELGPMIELVEDTFKWFIDLVVERRKIKLVDVPGLSQGRVYTGRQAVKLGLADEIGGEDEAVKWLVSEKQIEAELPVVERKVKSELSFNPLTSALQNLAQQFGLSPLVNFFSNEKFRRDQGGSGLMSIWRMSSVQ